MATVTPGNSEFDRDTAVVRRAPGVYDARLPAGWTVVHAVNGGFLLALMGRALGDTLPHPDPFSVTAHYLTASVPGPAVIRTEVVRTGRTMSTGAATLVQFTEDGTEVERLRVLGAYGDLDALPDDVRTSAKPPALPPYEHCLGADSAPGGQPPIPGSTSIADRLAVRLDPATAGWAVGAPSGKGEMRGWFGLADGRDHDPLSLLLAVDGMPPTAFDLGLSGWVPTVELTTHIRCRPAPGPLRVVLSTRNLAGGFLEEDGEIWDSQDRLVAQSRQLARALLDS
ncbi:thioesterase family protein [Streptomyces pinistramenti]|uniref:thioesterase family protein n=1 Tax=Streptomyces pinistramenti TaxID=2884812 RepID=UPI001D06CC6C|nr:thioesterase family protein [Streptomyces pinistramenti]MCB5908404.1 thioesterase family protein [Streptomyces pinistramenti]